ncbi:toprim domain-containing protein [Spiroplasma tabanidicola]|uniref:Recombination protein RecR n=1 Tax=Spiroplasma tabanidicola TaxID=324079 RepID=A0A6I6C915_9MOLU|nr:toprim domain-containing protein [Spiroplasma tabanidicola]QGS51375.1 recombination protein RecR [Spiroplasma tabanidicola]
MDEIIEILKEFEGIGSKAAKKIFFQIMTSNSKKDKLIEVINKISDNYSVCQICNFYKYKKVCQFCDDSSRDRNLICVVSYITDGQRILESNFKGLVHILNGEINLNKNLQPESLKIKELFARINKEVEILLALNLTFEGEVTANYIANQIKDNTKSVTRIARGIPLGGVLDYIDTETLEDAIKNRKALKK